MNTDPMEVAQEAATAIAQLSHVDQHDIAIVVGSGWGQAAKYFGDVNAEIKASDLPGFVLSHIEGHAGTVRSVRLESGKNALLIAARTHLYEGFGPQVVAHGVRTASACGARTMVLTNGCGSIRQEWSPGQVVLISDHINFTATTPLVGTEFVDLTDAYSPRLRNLAREVDPSLPEGVYIQFPGPQYETPAEIQMARSMGADLVGMSTVLETITARALGCEVLGLSLVTNPAAGITDQHLSHEDVLAAGADSASRIGLLLADIVKKL